MVRAALPGGLRAAARGRPDVSDRRAAEVQGGVEEHVRGGVRGVEGAAPMVGDGARDETPLGRQPARQCLQGEDQGVL